MFLDITNIPITLNDIYLLLGIIVTLFLSFRWLNSKANHFDNRITKLEEKHDFFDKQVNNLNIIYGGLRTTLEQLNGSIIKLSEQIKGLEKNQDRLENDFKESK
jgi:uncharacterized coiled-coil protein SlyX